MHPEPSIAGFLGTTLVAGVLGALAMELAMWLICRTGWAKGNMIVAVGALVTHSRETAFRAGAILHAVSAIVFAMIYYLAMIHLGLVGFPRALVAGIGFGVLHGLIVSLTLVWIAADHHPLEEFQEAGLAVGVSHFAGHIAYGAMVGLVIAIATT